MGHTVIGYLDDTLIIGRTLMQTQEAVSATTSLLSKLGFLIHPVKSVLNPAHEIRFLGFILNTKIMTVELPDEKKFEISQLCSDLLGADRPSIRTVARVIGKLVASFPAARYGPLFLPSIGNRQGQSS